MDVQQYTGTSGEFRPVGNWRQERFGGQTQTRERLPFTVRIVRTEDELSKAVAVRHSAYMRHVPHVGSSLRQAEHYDRDPGCLVFLAESRMDGSALGTIRLHSSLFSKLPLEQSVDLPDWIRTTRRAEATRLGVSEGRVGTLVKTALFKAYLKYCLSNDFEWIVMAARSPLDRTYEALSFSDVFPSGEYIPMRHAGNIPHRVLSLKVSSVESSWAQTKHPLHKFFFQTDHPDILLDH